MEFHWMNVKTGEIVENFMDVLKTEFYDLWNLHFIGIWKYSRKGF